MNQSMALLSICAMASFASAGIFNTEIRAEERMCLSGTIEKNSYLLHTFVIEKDRVFDKIEAVDEKGRVTPFGINEFEDCVIIDKNNWKCGGVRYKNGPYSNKTVMYQTINGKFSFDPGVAHVGPNINPGCDALTVWKQIN